MVKPIQFQADFGGDFLFQKKTAVDYFRDIFS